MTEQVLYHRPTLFDAEVARMVTLHRDACASRRLPGWEQIAGDSHGELWRNAALGLSLIWSVDREKDGRAWLHVSLAHRGRIPTWEELKAAKYWMVADDRYSYQVLPPASRYVNINPHVLHLWSVIDGNEPLPDFLREGGQI